MPNRHERRSRAKRPSPLITRTLSFPQPSVQVDINGSNAAYAMDAAIQQAMEIIDPADIKMTDPHTGTVININTSPEGIISYLVEQRDNLLRSGIDALKNHHTIIGGINTQQLVLMGVLDTSICSIDHICSLIRLSHWHAIPHISRAILDAYLIYDGIVFARDPLEYLEDIKTGAGIHDHVSVCGSDMTYTHIAEMASQKYPPISDLFKWHSTQHHYSLDSLHRLAWNSGEVITAGNRLRLVIGDSKGNFDQMAYGICTRVFQILEYSQFLGKKLTQYQEDAARQATAVRKAEQKQHKATIKKARQDRLAARSVP